jgi:cardiolipin synthase
MANLLTMGRILLIVPFAALFFVDAAFAMKAALLVFALAAVTDFLDGYVARARGEVSALGAALDPVADKLLVAATLLLLTASGVIAGVHTVAALIVLVREILVGGLREAIAERGARLAVTGLAKWKTAIQLIALALLLATAPQGFLSEAFRPLGLGALWLATILTFVSGTDYALRAARALKGPAS